MMKKAITSAVAALIIIGASVVCASASYMTYSAKGNEASLITVKSAGESVVVPQKFIGKKVTAIGADALRGNKTVKNVSLPENILSIEWGAFEDCASLEAINIPQGIERIEDMTFSGCASLCEISLPAAVKEIGVRAFALSGLKSAALPEGVLAIGDGAFAGCASLCEVEIPESVIYIGERVFAGCENVKLTVKDGSAAKEYALANGIPYTLKEQV